MSRLAHSNTHLKWCSNLMIFEIQLDFLFLGGQHREFKNSELLTLKVLFPFIWIKPLSLQHKNETKLEHQNVNSRKSFKLHKLVFTCTVQFLQHHLKYLPICPLFLFLLHQQILKKYSVLYIMELGLNVGIFAYWILVTP